MKAAASQISDHGLIGNGRTAALVNGRGSIDWCCFPRFDSSSIFASILDEEKGGSFSLSPTGAFESRQHYLTDTNVLETQFIVKNAKAKLIDLFTVGPHEESRLHLNAPNEILRIVECLDGSLEMEMKFEPSPDFGRKRIKIENCAHLGLRCDLGHALLLLQHEISPDAICLEDAGQATAKFILKKGEKLFFSFIYAHEAPAVIPPLGKMAQHRLERTINYWKNWISICKYEGEYNVPVRRSALALKLLLYAPSGAMIAAPTTSLPEVIGGSRNWDYRYCWLRDASFTLRSFMGLGFHAEARAYMGWILHSTTLTRPYLNVLYSIFGETKIPEKKLLGLKGYRKSRPVRIGNAADTQFQLDTYGEVIQAIYVYSDDIKIFDKDTIGFLLDIGKAVCRLWNKADEGIWEVRSQRVHYTHSKAMAWIALDRLIKLIEKEKWNAPTEVFKIVARQIWEDLEENGFHKDLNCYTRSYGSRELDASLILLPIMDYHPTSRYRLENTMLKIKEELSENDLVYRYKPGKDGLNGNEGVFLACSFWLVEALAKMNFHQEAQTLFKQLMTRENSCGLWSEELDPQTNEFLGNYPQAFTHTAIISAALALKGASQ
jgi:GH15 family glucan-1,4-alpha-glucosidase